MGFEFIRPLGVGGISSNIRINQTPRTVSFRGDLQTDRIEINSVGKYTSENFIRNQVETNPNIKNILKEMNAPTVLNMEELRVLQAGHATETKNVAMNIAENLPAALKPYVNKKAIQDAAYLHDLGKVLIPKEILNKPAKLNAAEQEIMHRHPELSYELLKDTNIDPTTLNLIRYHHQNPNHSGYPAVKNDFMADINLQILALADKYSALREARAYKQPLNAKEALTIIYKDVKSGNIHPFVFNALVNAENKVATKVAV